MSEPDPLPPRFQAALGDRYRFADAIGAGGMATVYAAQDVRHDRRVAVKILRPELASTIGIERFLREVRIAARLHHPHILGLLDSGAVEDVPYYVMPYVDGASLRARLLREGELPLEDGIRLLRQVLEALAYAHGGGIVHRDIKPENVLLSGDTGGSSRWHALVADFGVAKALTAAAAPSSLTATGVAIGTPAYMAPEQAAADPHVDHRADIYAAGVLAYEIFAGAPPFRGVSAPQVMAAHLTRTPEPVIAQRPSIPSELDAVIMRALEKRPADRWQRASDMLARLEAILTPTQSVAVKASAAPADRTFLLSEHVCRRLDRATLDPRIIGSPMHFLDNEVRSETLVFLIHGTGQDARVFRDMLPTLPYRAIAPTLLGMEPDSRRRIALPIANHVELLRELLRAQATETVATRTVLIGFSSGADLALRLAAAPAAETPRIDGLLALGPNLAVETCFVTGIYMRLGSDNEAEVLDGLRRFGSDSQTLEEWLKVHEYLVDTFRKFGWDLEPVRRFSADYTRGYRDNANLFADLFRGAAARVPAVRCLWEDAETCRRLLQDLRLRHLDDPAVLGDRYREDSLMIEPGAGHFDLLAIDRVRRHLHDIMGAGPQADTRRSS